MTTDAGRWTLDSCVPQRIDFSVRITGATMPAFADDLAAAHQHGANSRVRAGLADAATGERQRAPHESFILFGEAHVQQDSGSAARIKLSLAFDGACRYKSTPFQLPGAYQ